MDSQLVKQEVGNPSEILDPDVRGRLVKTKIELVLLGAPLESVGYA